MKEATFLNERRYVPRRRKLLFLLLAFFALTTIVAPQAVPLPAPVAEGQINAIPVPLDESDPARREIGELVFRQGWVLRADTARFGGISAMQIEDGRVIAVNDSGDLMRFRWPVAAGPTPVRIDAVPIAYGSPATKRNRDSESIIVADGRVWIGFERNNLIARYRRADFGFERFARPPAMRRWPRNSGAEAMVRLPDGRFIVFAEAANGPTSAVAIFAGDPSEDGTPAVMGVYRRPPGYRVTDAAVLPDGRLLLLNRRVNWLGQASAKLVIAGVPPSFRGAEIAGREIATLEAPLTVDNMEALSVAREGGRTIVRIASDDNFMGFGLQRTLLLEFELRERRGR